MIASAGVGGGGGGGGLRRRRHQPWLHSVVPRAQGRSPAIERSDLLRPSPPVVGNSGRHRPGECQRRQQPDHPSDVGRPGQRRAHGHRNPRRRSRGGTPHRPRRAGSASDDARDCRPAARARRSAAGACGVRGPAQGGALRAEHDARSRTPFGRTWQERWPRNSARAGTNTRSSSA